MFQGGISCQRVRKGPRAAGVARTLGGTMLKRTMKRIAMLRPAACAGLLALAAGIASPAFANVVTYPGPGGITAAADRQVSADGKPVFVYETAVNFNRAYTTTPTLEKTPVAYFDFSGSVAVTVTAPGVAITSAVLRPISCATTPTVAGDKVTFTLTKPGHMTLELNGDVHRALHLFADSIEAHPLTGGDGSTRYFGPGVYEAGEMNLASGQTIYIAGGAVVYGAIRGGSITNATVRGRGILSGNHINRDGGGWKNLVNIHSGSNNISVNGIILFDSPTWNMNIRQTNGMHIDDVKIIGARPNSDGIDIVGCQNASINHCFVRAWDDCLCVKSDNTGNTSNINFTGCTIWTDLAQSMEIGYETRADLMTGITFKDIDVIHAFHKPVMSIHVTDRALVEKVTWENIRVEDAKLNAVPEDNLLMDLWIGTSTWTQDAERGKINNVTFRNISVLGGKAVRNRIQGFDGGHRITGLTYDNVTIMGKPIKTTTDGAFLMSNNDAPTITWTAALPIGCTTGIMERDDMPILKLVPGETRSLLYRRPGDASGAVWDLRGRSAAVPAAIPLH